MSLLRMVVGFFCLASSACIAAPEEGPTRDEPASLPSPRVDPRPSFAPRVPKLAPPIAIGCTHDSDCDDGDACTIDSCASHHCAHALIDDDGDGFAPASLGACGADCNDVDARVFPGQTLFFATPSLLPSGALSFDYDCDGEAQKELDELALCIGAATKDADGKESEVCTCAPGWSGSIANCGVTADYATATTCGSTAAEPRTQACR